MTEKTRLTPEELARLHDALCGVSTIVDGPCTCLVHWVENLQKEADILVEALEAMHKGIKAIEQLTQQQRGAGMTDARFNELLAGPLAHPLVPFRISRLALALKAVVDATGEAGARALEAYAAARDERDEAVDREDLP